MAIPRALLALSMKGGVGKTTTTIGLGQALQRQGKKVALLDVDIHGSALPRALHLAIDPGYEALRNGKLQPVQCDGFQVFSIGGLLLHEDSPNMWKGEIKASAVKQIATTSIDWAPDLDWVVVDTPPTSGDEVQSLLEHLPNIYGSVVITQPNDLSILGIGKTLNLLRETESPVCGILVNMAGYTCPHCGEVSNPFDRESGDFRSQAEAFEVPYLGEVPLAGEAKRADALDLILARILKGRPVLLPKSKGGIRLWALKKLIH